VKSYAYAPVRSIDQNWCIRIASRILPGGKFFFHFGAEQFRGVANGEVPALGGAGYMTRLSLAGMKRPQRGSAGAQYQEVLSQSQAATAATFLKMVSSTLQGFTTIGIVRHGS
jgi:hypothetical protein